MNQTALLEKTIYKRTIGDQLKVCLSVPEFSDELFELTDKNRDFLMQWLPWLDSIQGPSDTRMFIELQLSRFRKGEAVHQTIFYQDRIAGVLGFNRIDPANGIGYLGYWLAREYNGRGIMTRSVRDLITLGFAHLGLQRIDIRCAVKNKNSRAIPERLGFKNEGTIRRAEKVNHAFNDHVIYGLLKEETGGRDKP